MSDNLVEWLAPYRENTGPIFATDPRKRMSKVCTASGVTWKRNALRHSFGSYRMEATKNAGQVALEMGNSPAVVMAHYHEIVHSAEAKAYWSIRPMSPAAPACALEGPPTGSLSAPAPPLPGRNENSEQRTG